MASLPYRPETYRETRSENPGITAVSSGPRRPKLRELATGRTVLLCLSGFLLGRASLADGSICLGPAFFEALLLGRLNPRVAALAGFFTLAGLFSAQPGPVMWQYGAILIAISVLGRPGTKTRRTGFAAARAGLAVLAVRLISMAGAAVWVPYDTIIIGLEALFIPAAALVFAQGIRVMSPVSTLDPTRNRGNWVAAAAVISSAIGGLSGVHIGPVSLLPVACALLILVSAHTGGAGAGAAMGAALGLLSRVGPWDPPVAIPVVTLAGAIGGLFSSRRKWGTVVGCGAGALLLHPSLGQPTALLWPAAGAGLAIMAFAFIPDAVLWRLGARLPGTQQFLSRHSDSQRRLKEMVGGRLKELADIFARLAQTFEDAPAPDEEAPRGDLDLLMEKVSTHACGECQSRGRCWDDNFYQTYRELFDLVVLAETKGEVATKDLKGRLARACIQPYQLLSTVNSLLQVCHVNRFWQKRLDESRGLVSSQLKGVSSLMDGLAGQLRLDAEYQDDLQIRISDALNRLGLNPQSVSVVGAEDKQFEVQISKRPCGGKGECLQVVAPFLSRMMGRPLAVWQRHCLANPGRSCASIYCPRRAFTVRLAVRQLAKDGNPFCGDTFEPFELKDGRFMLLLSDGVGVGPRAAMESSATVSVLKQLLSSGIDRDFAVQVVNNILHLRSPEETFSTVDLTAVDLFTGEAEFVKIGAAPTYIKRGHEVVVLRSSSLPVGIFLSRIEMDTTSRMLQDGDVIVMVTDGIIESFPVSDPSMDYTAQLLGRLDVMGVEALADYLVERVRQNSLDGIKDDLTVVVAQVERVGGLQ